MVDDERLKQLRALGVKSVAFMKTDDEFAISHVEFFPSIPALDLDSLVPPAPEEGGEVEVVASVPRALANILKRKSVS